ncbi:MAG: hypothetical protein MJ249_01190 [Kiritimatiellae bacterium]|nr:hypothetical protein [Kiritimatiellia bacterium]
MKTIECLKRTVLVVGALFAGALFGEVATAKWTGAGDRTNISDPRNWECYDGVGDVIANAVPNSNETIVSITGETDFNCPVGSSILWKSIGISGTVTLKADCDWRGLGSIFGGYVLANTTINLKGYELFVKVPNGSTNKRINVTDDSPQGEGGRFHIEVAEGDYFTNSGGWDSSNTFWFSGTMELVKDGPGTYKPSYAIGSTGFRHYTYTGGTTLHEGLIELGNDNEGTKNEDYYAQKSSRRPVFGDYRNVKPFIRIDAGATFDYKGVYDIACYQTYMNGGTIKNTRKPRDPQYAAFGDLIFEADSYFDISRTAQQGGYFYLNGHTLTVTIAAGQDWLCRNGSGENGTIIIRGDGVFHSYNSAMVAPTVNFDIGTATVLEQPLTVQDYIARYDGTNFSASANVTMQVTGRFKPLTRSFIPCALLPNSTLDLSTKTEAWDQVGVFGAIKFPRGTVTIDVGDRKLANGEKVVATVNELEDLNVRIVGTNIQSTESARIKTDGIYYDIPQGNMISRATWTGAGRNNDFDDPANWTCVCITGEIVSAVPTADTTVYFGMINFDLATRDAVAKIASYKNVFLTEGTIALSRDCDWRGLSAFDPLLAGKVIELAGHTFQLTGLDGSTPYSFTVKDSSGTDGKFIVDVPAGAVFENSAIKLDGSLQLIKMGEGTYVPRYVPQGYTNLTQIVAGMIKLYNPSTADDATYANKTVPHALGVNGTPLRVESNGTIDIYGVYDMANVPIILNGGILTNTKKQAQYEWGGLGNIVLEADSFVDMPVSTVFRSDSKPTNLNGHTLTVRMPENDGSNSLEVHMYTRTTVYTNGNLRITGIGVLDINGNDMRATTANVDIEATIWRNGNLNVSNFVSRYTGVYSGGANSIHVYGSFNAPVNQFPPVVMHEGAVFDVSARTAETPMPLVSLIGSVSYAANTTNIVIDVGSRTLSSGEKLLAWEVLPENINFSLRGDNVPAEYTLVPNEMGLFYNPSIDSRIVLKATWTGAAGDNNLSNPANWTQCKNMFNIDVVGGVPGGAAVVTLQGPVGFSVPLGASLPWQKVLFNSVVFTQDVDWRGLAGFFNYQNANAVLDLNGHKLFVRPSNGNPTSTCTVTDTSTNAEAPGELHLCQDAGSTFSNNKVTLVGNLRLVKEGEGTFTPAKINLAYTGGNEIRGGMILINNPGASGSSTYAMGQANGKNPLGAYNSKPVIIWPGTTYDINGIYDSNRMPVELAGGTLKNSKDMVFHNDWGAMNNITVTAEGSTFEAAASTEINGSNFNLGGYELNVKIGSGKDFFLRGGAQNGTFKFLYGGFATTVSGSPFDAHTVTFDVNCALNIGAVLSVSNYVARYTGNYNRGAAELAVYGTFTPVSEKFYGCTLQDGSTLNLTDKTGVWNVKAAFPAGDANCTGLDTVTFAENARINIDLGEREFEFVDGLAQVIAWTERPDSTVTFKSNSKALKGNRRFFINDTGLYVMRTSLTIFFR